MSASCSVKANVPVKSDVEEAERCCDGGGPASLVEDGRERLAETELTTRQS